MSKETNIQWCDSTVNPTGFQCDGCELWLPKANPPVKKCYAGRWAECLGGVGAFDRPIELKPGRMAKAARWPDLRGQQRPGKPWLPFNYPRLIFIGDMSDNFSKGVPFEYLFWEVIGAVSSKNGKRHIWMWLTKQPKRMAEFSRWMKSEHKMEWPSNLWVGTSVTTPEKLHRIIDLQSVGETWTPRFITFEPLLGECDWTPLRKMLFRPEITEFGKDVEVQELFGLGIIGGDSDPRPEMFDMVGAADLINILKDADISVFVKQLGKLPVCGNANLFEWPGEEMLAAHGEGFASVRLMTRDPKGGDPAEWPKEFRLRDFPHLGL